MRPPALGVRPDPRDSRDQRWPLEVQPHTSHHIYGAASLFLLTILRLPSQQHTAQGPAPPTSVLTTKPSPAAMEATYSCPLQLQEDAFLFDSLLEKSYKPAACDPASDPGYFSAASSLSPTSSVDSFCFSPISLQTAGSEQDGLESFIFNSPAASLSTTKTQTVSCSRPSTTASISKKSRTRYPGKKRQTASEREKLRMRDLTKALHHLRTYLPPSVAPAGQTLTKIDTLRLTIRYISYLSDQLGLSEEVLEQRRSSGFAQLPQTLNQFLGQPTVSYSLQESGCNMANTAQLSPLQHLYQVSSEQCWLPQQPAHGVSFPGQC